MDDNTWVTNVSGHSGRKSLVALLRSLSAMLATLVLAGCATTYPMMPTPVLYTGALARSLFTSAPNEALAPPLDLLFLTDRAPATGRDDFDPYTAERSRSMAFGSATVLFGEGLTWETLVRESLVFPRTHPLELSLGPTKELGRFPSIPYEVTMTERGLTRSAAVVAAHEAAVQGLQAEVARRLASSPRKEVVLFVHGVADTFRDAALTMGELCHFLGRELVCGIFTWPAGGTRGVLFGYEVDYESSEFAAEHLRKTIRAIAETPGLERIHLIAHSRGTDVLVTAASDLNFEAYTQESNFSQRYKIGNVVLVAPDLDIDVNAAKFFKVLSDPDLPYGSAPNPKVVLGRTPDFRITVYVSPDDRALATSGSLFGSIARLGRLSEAMLTPRQIEQVRTLGMIDVIQVEGRTDLFGHSYLTSNPKVSSDLIAMLRYRLAPNDPGRPLEEVERPFWRIPAGQGK
jgi:esterase/lipase superfamily enzyme